MSLQVADYFDCLFTSPSSLDLMPITRRQLRLLEPDNQQQQSHTSENICYNHDDESDGDKEVYPVEELSERGTRPACNIPQRDNEGNLHSENAPEDEHFLLQFRDLEPVNLAFINSPSEAAPNIDMLNAFKRHSLSAPHFYSSGESNFASNSSKRRISEVMSSSLEFAGMGVYAEPRSHLQMHNRHTEMRTNNSEDYRPSKTFKVKQEDLKFDDFDQELDSHSQSEPETDDIEGDMDAGQLPSCVETFKSLMLESMHQREAVNRWTEVEEVILTGAVIDASLFYGIQVPWTDISKWYMSAAKKFYSTNNLGMPRTRTACALKKHYRVMHNRSGNQKVAKGFWFDVYHKIWMSDMFNASNKLLDLSNE